METTEQRNAFTEGPILRPLIRFTVPIMLALFLQAMYGAVDLIVVGQFAGDAGSVSAVSTGSTMMNLPMMIIFGLTMGAELMNTAIERLCDRQASGYDGFVRNAKDIAAAGVFVCAAACVAVGVCVFLAGGVLLTALQYIFAHLWIAMALVVTVPIALWFIFYYGRIQ